MATSKVSREQEGSVQQITTKKELPDEVKDRVLGTIFGQCCGDTLGLLTEFMPKTDAKMYFKGLSKSLEFEHKQIVCDMHRMRWDVGDWTDDSDQMILSMLSIIEKNGKVDIIDFAKKLKHWMSHGFPELGDRAGLGIGRTTAKVLTNPKYTEDPHHASELVWNASQRQLAPNGAVMRTAFLGVHCFHDLQQVKSNAVNFAKATHFDPRCRASAVALSVAIAILLQRNPSTMDKKGKYKVDHVIDMAYEAAASELDTDEQKAELQKYLRCKDVKKLELDESGKIGYTYKSLGSAFWAFKQDDFRKAITKIVLQGGDADTNACTAGALLGCKLGYLHIPESWRGNLKHKDWLDQIINRYAETMGWEQLIKSDTSAGS